MAGLCRQVAGMALICIERAFGRLDGFISLVLGTSTEASSGDSLAGLRRPSQSAAIVHRSDLKGISQHPDCASSQWHGSRGPRPLLQLDEVVHMFELTLPRVAHPSCSVPLILAAVTLEGV